jgi:hypothetical protein
MLSANECGLRNPAREYGATQHRMRSRLFTKRPGAKALPVFYTVAPAQGSSTRAGCRICWPKAQNLDATGSDFRRMPSAGFSGLACRFFYRAWSKGR